MTDYYAGDIIRVSRATSNMSGPNLLLEGEVGWALCDCDSYRRDDGVLGDVGIWWIKPKRLGTDCPFLDSGDTFRLADPDEIPDDVLAAVTAAALGGKPVTDNREDD